LVSGRIEPHRFRLYKAELLEKFSGDAGRVLDIGCGYRRYERFCRGSEYIGLDKDLSFRPTVQSVGEKLPFRDSCIDTVIMFDVVEHLSDVKEALRECVRVLRKGGSLVITTPNTWGFGFYDSFADRTHRHHFSWASLEKRLRESGLVVEKRIPLHLHIFWPLRRIHSKLLMPLQQSICVVARR